MKRQRWITLLAVVLVAAACGGLAFAVDSLLPTVIYDASSGSFSYENTDENGLFGDFQDLMPGDSRTTEIRLELRNLSKTTRVYLRAEPEAGDRLVLEPLTLSVSRNGILLDRQTGMNSLSRNTLIGSFTGSETVRLDVALSVPVTVGNEAAEKTGSLQWIFTVQEDGGTADPGGTGGDPSGPDGPSVPDEPAGQMLNSSDHFAYIIGYEDGSVRPNENITRGEVATIFFRLLSDDVRELYLSTWNPFEDMSDQIWCNTAVSTLYNLGVLYGRVNGSYDHNAAVTGAGFAAIAAWFCDDEYSGETLFSDIKGHWAENEINRAAESGWVQGLPDGTFQPERPITRAEAIALVNHVLGRTPGSESDLLPDMRTWSDNVDKSAWYYLDVQEATNSHDFLRREDQAEQWTQLTPSRDWKRYEVPSFANG